MREALPDELREHMDSLDRAGLKAELRVMRDQAATSGWEATLQAVRLAYEATGRIDEASVAVSAARAATGTVTYDEPVDLGVYDGFMGVRTGAREDQRADVSLLVDDDQRAGAGPLEQPVDVVGPVCQLGPEGDAPSRIERARAVRALPDVDPQVGHGRLCCRHGVSSPLSRPLAAEATPTLPGRGPVRARHISISRSPRPLPPRRQHVPGPLRGRG